MLPPSPPLSAYTFCDGNSCASGWVHKNSPCPSNTTLDCWNADEMFKCCEPAPPPAPPIAPAPSPSAPAPALPPSPPPSAPAPSLPPSSPPHPPSESSVAELYEAAGGSAWSNASGWLDAGRLCSWAGVQCDDSDAVTHVDLRGNGLTGTIPVELSGVSSLTWLNLRSNAALSGTVAPQIASLANLQTLSVYSTAVSGTLPEATVTDAQWLLFDSAVSGTVPPSAVATLRQLHVGRTRVSGTLPAAAFGDGAALRVLSVQYAACSGTLPTELGNVLALDSLAAADSRISGTLPTQLGRLSSLGSLLLQSASLSGAVPSQLGRLTDRPLSILRLEANRLSSTVPSQLAALDALTVCSLSTAAADDDASSADDGGSFVSDGNRYACPLPTGLALPCGAPACVRMLCENSCSYNDGLCDDGGPGTGAGTSGGAGLCPYGTDCADCGPRFYRPPPSQPPPAAPPPSAPPTPPSLHGRDAVLDWLRRNLRVTVAVAGGLASLLFVALVRRGLRPRATPVDCLVLAFALADLVMDVLFLMQLREERGGRYGRHDDASLDGFFAASLTIMAVTLLVGLAATLRLITRDARRPQRTVDGGWSASTSALLSHAQLSERPRLYAAVVLVACSRLDLLRLLPWVATGHAGFPTARVLLFTQLSVLLE